MLPRFRRIVVKDEELRLVQDACDKVFNELGKKELVDGRLIEDVSLTTSFQNIEHKLGRALIGWVVVRNNADARVWDNQASNTTPSKTLSIRASAATTVSLWVF